MHFNADERSVEEQKFMNLLDEDNKMEKRRKLYSRQPSNSKLENLGKT